MPVAPAPPAANGPPPRAGGRPSQPDGDPFSSVLEQQARTATAEGLSKHQDANDAPEPSVSPDSSAQQTVEVAQPAADGTDPAAVAAAIADFLGVPLSTPETAAPGAAGQVPAGQPGTAPGTVPTGPAQAQPAVPALPATPAAPIAAEAAPAAPPTVAAPAAATAPPAADAAAAQAATATDADGTPAPQPAVVSADAAATTHEGAADDRQGAGQQQSSGRDPRAAAPATTLTGTSPATPAAADASAAPAPTASASAAASAPAAASGAGAAQAAAASQPAAAPAAVPATQPVGAPTGTAAPAAPAPAHGAVTLDRAVETVRLAMRAGAERGVTHARIALSPAELGGIEIHLRHTVDGIVARVVADATGAAQLLQQSASDLRRQLEQQGVNVLRLDVAASGEEQRRAGAQSGFGESAGRGSGGTANGDETIVVGTTAATSTDRVELPNGALVDVLA
jgi:flagellar hook-length control protein FliK